MVSLPVTWVPLRIIMYESVDAEWDVMPCILGIWSTGLGRLKGDYDVIAEGIRGSWQPNKLYVNMSV